MKRKLRSYRRAHTNLDYSARMLADLAGGHADRTIGDQIVEIVHEFGPGVGLRTEPSASAKPMWPKHSGRTEPGERKRNTKRRSAKRRGDEAGDPGGPCGFELGAEGTMPMRDREKGCPLVWEGTITSTDGKPLAG
jgi:hypothetical protein